MPDHFYVYPTYLGRTTSRRDGRRIPAPIALADVTCEELLAAARQLGYSAEIEAEKQYPRTAFRYEGRLKVKKRASTPKSSFLRQLATEVQRRRTAAGKK